MDSNVTKKSIQKYVSVVIPVYNVEKYLEDCLESIVRQTFFNFEILLIDDGSTDSSGDICEEYQKKDFRIRVFHQENQGQSAARNKGIELSETDWILFVDSDDVVHPHMVEYFYTTVMETGAKVATCMRVQEPEIPDDFFCKNDLVYNLININEETLYGWYKEDNDAYWALFPSLVKKEIVMKIPFTNGKIYEDNAVSCQWLYEAKKVALLPMKLYFYRDNPLGTMRKAYSVKKLDYLWALREQLRFYERIQYTRMLNVIAKEYIGATVWECNCISDELKDDILRKQVLRKTKKECNRLKKYIQNYSIEIDRIDKLLNPHFYKIKKKLTGVKRIIKNASVYINNISLEYGTWQIALRPMKGQCLYEGHLDDFYLVPNSSRYWRADPFLFKYKNENYLFAEMYDRKKEKGVIGVAKIKKGKCGRFRVCLNLPYHLSYPCVFEENNNIYMIPECNESGRISLYKCESFPMKWKEVRVISNIAAVDTTPVFDLGNHIVGYYTSIYEPELGGNDNLYYLKVDGSAQPLIINNTTSRMAGHLIYDGNTIIRPTQDDSVGYGDAIIFNEVINFDFNNYEEKQLLKVLSPNGKGLDKEKIGIQNSVKNIKYIGIHTYNKNNEYEVIDLKIDSCPNLFVFWKKKDKLGNKIFRKFKRRG